MSYAYAYQNLLSGLAASAFTWSAGLNDTTRSRLNDGKMGELYVNGSPTSSLSVVIDLGAASDLAGWAVLNSNCAVQKTVTLTIESADNSGMSTNLATRKAASTLNTARIKNKDHVFQLATGTARRYWRLTWAWTGTVTSFQVGELWAYTAATQLSRRAVYGDGEGRTFKTVEVEYYNGGTRSFRLGGPLRSLVLPYVDLTPAQVEELFSLLDLTNGGVTPFLWINSYEATATAAAVTEQEVIYGKLGQPDFHFTTPDFQLHQPNDFLIKSLGREIGA